MSQISPGRRRPPLPTVLFWLAGTVLWWTGLCLAAGRVVWLW